MYDSNEDGVIDFEEFLSTTHIMCSGTPEENLRCIFRFFDVNGDGYLERDELLTVVRDLLGEDYEGRPNIVDEVFKEMNVNGEGKACAKQFSEACLDQKPTTTMLTMNVVKVFLDT